MAVHKRKAFKAGEPVEFSFKNGNVLMVSPAGGDIHGAFIEAQEAAPSGRDEDARFASVILEPTKIMALFSKAVLATGFTQADLKAIAERNGLVRDSLKTADITGGAPWGNPTRKPVKEPYTVTDRYGDKVTVSPVDEYPGLIYLHFVSGEDEAKLMVPPDLLMMLFAECTRVVNFTAQEMRELTFKSGEILAPAVQVGRAERRAMGLQKGARIRPVHTSRTNVASQFPASVARARPTVALGAAFSEQAGKTPTGSSFMR